MYIIASAHPRCARKVRQGDLRQTTNLATEGWPHTKHVHSHVFLLRLLSPGRHFVFMEEQLQVAQGGLHDTLPRDENSYRAAWSRED